MKFIQEGSIAGPYGSFVHPVELLEGRGYRAVPSEAPETSEPLLRLGAAFAGNGALEYVVGMVAGLLTNPYEHEPVEAQPDTLLSCICGRRGTGAGGGPEVTWTLWETGYELNADAIGCDAFLRFRCTQVCVFPQHRSIISMSPADISGGFEAGTVPSSDILVFVKDTRAASRNRPTISCDKAT